MPQPRQIKIKYPNMSEPIYVNSISEAIELSKFTIDAIKDCLSGDRKDIQGITFEYASKTPKDKVTRGIKDSTANLKGRNTGKGVKVTNVETGEVRCFPKRTEALTYMGYKSPKKSLKPYIDSGELVKGKYKLEEWTLEDEEEMYFQRAQTAIDKVESNDIRSKLQGILSQVRYDKYESFNPKQIREILPFKRWIEDAYYSGPDAVKLYPFWKKFLTDVFDSGKNITEAVLAGSIGCQVETQRIPTNKGILSYREIKNLFDKGEEIYVLSEEGINKVLGAWDKGIEPTKIITFRDGSIVEGTYEHKIRALRDGQIVWVEYQDLKVGDKVIKTNKECPLGNKRLRPSEAYMLGYLTGDGWVCSGNNKIQICIGDIERYENSMQELYKIFEEISSTGHVTWNPKDNENYATLSISNKDYHNWLLDNNIGQGSRNKRVPNIIYQCCKEDILDYIAGLIDSDGHLGIGNDGYCSLEIKSTSMDLLRDVQELLYALGIHNSIIDTPKRWGKKACRLSIKDIDKIKDLGLDLRIQYKKEVLEKQRTSTKSLQIPALLKALKPYSYLGKGYFKIRDYAMKNGCSIKTLNKLVENVPQVLEDNFVNYLYDKQIKEYEVINVLDSECFCMDLTIENSPTYLFNGFISHNTGKTTASLYGLMYKLYTLSCYENTAGLFNLMVTSKIAMIYFTISVKQAEKLGYGQLRSMVDSTPYFKDKFPRQDRIQSKLVFPENVEITYGSNNNHAIGLNLIASLLDEANFFKEEADETVVSAVYELYSSIIARGRSRYLHGGWNHSICFLVSSSTHQGSFTEKRINEGRKDNFEHMCVAAPRLWDVKPKGTYSDKRFYVFGGNENIDPLLLDTIQDVNRVRSALFMPLLDSNNVEDACKKTMQELKDELIIPIPVDFRKDFENDIIKGLQDIAGYSTAPSGFLFSSRPMYNKCVDKDYKHPFLQESLCISTNEPEHIWDYLIKGYEFKDKHQPHFISVDASTKHDSTGISMIHLKDIEVDEYGVSKPIIQVDFMLRITPPLKPFEIDIAKIREFIRYLRDEQDINIYGVSYDQYASAESLQLLRQQGFNAIQQSVIRSDVPHKDFVHIIQEGRLITYNYKPFESELFNMQHNRVKHKVFITPGATQYHGDTYMSLIGAFMHLMSVLDELPLTNENLTLGEDFYKDQYEIDTQEMMDSLVDGALNGLMDVDYDDLWDEDDDFIDY